MRRLLVFLAALLPCLIPYPAATAAPECQGPVLGWHDSIRQYDAAVRDFPVLKAAGYSRIVLYETKLAYDPVVPGKLTPGTTGSGQIKRYLQQLPAGMTAFVEIPELALAAPTGAKRGKKYKDPDWPAIEAYINALKNEPGLAGWYVADEPDWTRNDWAHNPALFEELVRRIRRLDPDARRHPTLIIFTRAIDPKQAEYRRSFALERYVKAVDLVGLDWFPMMADTGPFASNLSAPLSGWKRLKELADRQGKGLVWCPQALGRDPEWLARAGLRDANALAHNRRLPTEAEARYDAWMGLLHGADELHWAVRYLISPENRAARIDPVAAEIQRYACALSGPDLSAQVTVRNGRRNPQAAPPAVSIGELQVQRGGSWETLWGESVTLRSGKAQTVTFGQRSLELRPGDRRLRFRVRKDATVLGASLKLEVQAAAGPKAWLEASETYGTGKTLHPGWRIDWSGLTDSWLEIDLLQATPGPSGAPVPAFPGGVHLRSLKLAANPLPPKEYQARLDANHGVTARLRQDAQTGASYLFLINDSAFTVRDVSISGAARQAIEAMAPYEVRILPVP